MLIRRNIALACTATISLVLSLASCSNSGRQAANTSDALIEDARRLTGEHKVREALDTLARAKQADPTRTDIYLLRSTLLEQSANLTDALREVLAAHKLDPKNSEITMRALKLGINWMHPAESEALAHQVVAQHPEDPDAQLMLGSAIAKSDRLDRFPEALRALQRANQIDPEFPAPILDMGKLYSRMGDNVKAAAMLESAVKLLDLQAQSVVMTIPDLEGWLENRRTATFRLSQVYSRMGRTADARDAMSATATWTSRRTELRLIKTRAFSTPPDVAAQTKFTRIGRQGLSYWKEKP